MLCRATSTDVWLFSSDGALRRFAGRVQKSTEKNRKEQKRTEKNRREQKRTKKNEKRTKKNVKISKLAS